MSGGPRPPHPDPLPAGEREKIVLKRKDEGLEAEFNTMSMTGVIFVLLIFYVSLSETRTSPGGVILPVVAAAEHDLAAAGPPPVTIEVTADDRVYMDGELVASDEALVRRLEELARRAPAGSGPRVRLRGDTASTFGAAARVLARLAEAGITKIEMPVKSGT